MNLLLEFLCRFAWGLAFGLAVTPSALVPAGFFRVNLLVVMGLCTFAALVAWSAAAGGEWVAAVAAAVVAWMGSVAWLGEKRRAGMTLVLVCGGITAGFTAWLAARGDSPPLAGAIGAIGAIVSGLVTGLTVHAMLLGHWYLNAPGTRVDVLRRLTWIAVAAVVVQFLIAAAGVPRLPPLAGDPATVALIALRWLAGLVGLPILLVMSQKTLEIPNTQSATGILYVACLAAITGELAAQLLQTRTHWPV